MSGDLLEFAAGLQRAHEGRVPAEHRRSRGQVFTPASVCRFMAAMIPMGPGRLRLLDAGAGVGSLAAAVCERAIELRGPLELAVTLCEDDESLRPLIERNMSRCAVALEAVGSRLRYEVRGDFLAGDGGGRQRVLFADDTLGEFDAAIMNPPYFKTPPGNKGEDGTPNVYAGFLDRAIERLRPGGYLISITPRSFCSGPYFREFRRRFFARMGLEWVHLFESRRKVFEGILQESVIMCSRRGADIPGTVRITTSRGAEVGAGLWSMDLPAARLLGGSGGIEGIFIPTDEADLGVLDAVAAWPGKFSDLRLKVSTGPVVPFRVRDRLSITIDGGTVPLLGSHNVRPFRTTWPVRRGDKPIAFRVGGDSARHLIPSRNYVLLRRFSAKEERRRLTASWYLDDGAPPRLLALENHLNYVSHIDRELSKAELFGMTAVFNSSLMDKYFRMISGNTQVNATEIRSTPFPDLARIAAIGRLMSEMDGMYPAAIEEIVYEQLDVAPALRASLRCSA